VTADPYEGTESVPFDNPLPENHPQHATYENRVVFHQYASPVIFRDLLGYAFPNKPEGGEFQTVEFDGPSGKKLTFWTTLSGAKSP
jgi:hypothetical protein